MWGNNANTWAVGTTAGTHRFFHWLADGATDKSVLFAIEDGDTVNVVAIEMEAKAFNAAGTGATSCTAAATTYGLATMKYVKGSGASSTILGASALIAGVLASLF